MSESRDGESTTWGERAYLRAAFAARQAVAAISLLLILCPFLARSSWSAEPIKQGSAGLEFQKIGPGIEHLRLTRGHKSDSVETGPLLINLLKIDLGQVDLRVAHALDEGVGLETTSSMAARYGAAAAVNAGFFRTTGTYRGESSGALVLEGKLISEPIEGRAAFGLSTNAIGTSIIFGHLKFSGKVGSTRGPLSPVNGINRPRESGELIVYTPQFHRTTLTTPDGVEAIVRRNRVAVIHDGFGSAYIPSDGFVISACGRAREWVVANLRIGTQVRLETKLLPVESIGASLWARASYIVGGGPQLIKGGKVAITFQDEKIDAKFVTDRHPRTAIARLNDGRILLVTVDGRQPEVSVGISLTGLADLLLEFGASEAINLDGGGSTTMVVGGRLVNKPSDQTGERPVSDAILMLPRTLQQKGNVH